MPQRILTQLDPTTRDRLLLDVGGTCPLSRCAEEVWDVALTSPSGGWIYENLLPVCRRHFELIKTGTLSITMLSSIKHLITQGGAPRRPPAKLLKSRQDYLREVITQISRTGSECYLTYVGPLCLHPEWYFERRDADVELPNMDRAVRDYLRKASQDGDHTVWIIFRNSERYRQKLEQYVRRSERERFVEELLGEVDLIWGKQGERGPQLCCLDTGHYHIPLVFKEAAIAASRSSKEKQIESGILYTEPLQIHFEKQSYMNLFAASQRSQQAELEQLRSFVKGIWGDA